MEVSNDIIGFFEALDAALPPTDERPQLEKMLIAEAAAKVSELRAIKQTER